MSQALTAVAAKEVAFEYTYAPVNDIRVTTIPNEKTGKPEVHKVIVQDREFAPSSRFWNSLYSRFGFNSAVFKYFDHLEVFNRISERSKSDQMRLCIELDGEGSGMLLGVSNPAKPIVVYDELMEMLGKYRGRNVTYANGIVESMHTPRNGANQFNIAGDEFFNRFMMATAIDGYGSPSLYLSILRTVCLNGAVGYSKEFRSTLALGKGEDDVSPMMGRALDGFNNDEGFAALRQRFESAATSWASVYETSLLYKALIKLHANDLMADLGGVTPEGAKNVQHLLGSANPSSTAEGAIETDSIGSPVIKAFHAMTGDTCKLYGLANLDALSVKRQRTLPVRCTVYDAINFATEVATHYATPMGARMLQAWLGNTITDEYDMEGTKDKYGDFADFHIDSKVKAGLTGSQFSSKA